MLNWHQHKHSELLMSAFLQATSPWPQRWRGFEERTQEISYTHRSPLHLAAPISSRFCLLSFLSFELSFFLPFLPPPLISYCASLWNVHRPRISKCHCSVCWKALCALSSSPSDMSTERKDLHGRVIKSLSLKKTQEDEEWKRENPETIFDSDSPTFHTMREQIWTKWPCQEESRCVCFYLFSHLVIVTTDLPHLCTFASTNPKDLYDKSRGKKHTNPMTANLKGVIIIPTGQLKAFYPCVWQPRGPIAKCDGERDVLLWL